MEIYIEYVLIDNTVINFLIILFTKKILKLDVKNRNILICSLLGAAFSFLIPYLSFYNILLFLFKLFVGVLLVSLLKKYHSYKEFFVTFFTFISSTFLFGGLVFFILDVINAKTTSSGVLIYEYQMPMGLIILIIYLYAYFMFQLIRNFYKRKLVNNYLFNVAVKLGQKSFNTTAFLDTGNRLTDSVSGKPIVIINYYIFSNIYEQVNVADLLLGKLEKLPLKNSRYMTITSANGIKSKLLIFEGEELQIFLEHSVNIIPNVMFGLSLTKFEDTLEYSMLLNPLLLNI